MDELMDGWEMRLLGTCLKEGILSSERTRSLC